MLVNVNGAWTSVPDDTPQTLPWDEQLSSNPTALGNNRGCPPGYFAQYVAGTLYGTEIVCRRFDQQIATNPHAVSAESNSPSAYEATVTSMADASRAVVETASGLALPGMGILIAVAAIYFFLTRR